MGVLTSRKLAMACIWALTVAGLVCAAYREKDIELGSGCFGLAVLISMGLTVGLVVNMFSKKVDADAVEVFAGISGFSLLLALFSITFYYSVDGHVFIVSGKTTLSRSMIAANPFGERVKAIRKNQEAEYVITAVTRDGVGVSGLVSADFWLSKDEAVIRKVSAAYAKPNESIKQGLAVLLQRQFRGSIATKNLSELQNNLVLEHRTGQSLDPGMYGCMLAGQIRVSDLHAYFNK